MIKNYLKVAWRSMMRNSAHSLINISGLSIGIVSSLLILLWVQDEYHMDNLPENRSTTFAVYEHRYSDHQLSGGYYTPGLLAAELKKNLPEMQYATAAQYNTHFTFQANDKILKEDGGFAGADYFRIFGYPLLEGNEDTALGTPESIAISRRMAEALYGSSKNAMAKTIRYENKKDLIVTAVFEDLPENTSKKFQYLINWDEFLASNPWAKNWGNNGPNTYVQLRPDTQPGVVEKKIAHFLDNLNMEQIKGGFTIELGLQRFDQVYLHDNFKNGIPDTGRIEYVHLFSMVAVFVLLIACANFINLSTARSVRRSKEIGVRKVVGAMRSVLIKQFIGESMLFTVVSVLFSLVLLSLLLPYFNDLTKKQIAFPFDEPGFWIKIVILTAITGLIAGSYPALLLSSFNPVKVLKGKIKPGSGETFFRKGLVVFQFASSIVLIIGAFVVSRQIGFIQARNLGYDRENLIYMPLNGNLISQYDVFKTASLQLPGIQSITRSSNTPTDIQNSTGGIDWPGKAPDNDAEFTYISTGYDYARTMMLKLTSGRDYSINFTTDSAGYLVNEAALKKIGYKNPIGQPLTFWGKPGKIIGVLKDFHYTSLHDEIKPLIIRFGEQEKYGSALIRTKPGQTRQALASLESICKQLNPNFTFTYSFSDEEYQNLYKSEGVIGKLSKVFAFLAIFISCLGLLGLAMFTAEQRTKEMGIRKILGASAVSLFAALSAEFILLVITALLIAVPIAYFAMAKWLQSYQYRAELSWWIFALSALFALIITMITISLQALKASLINPVKTLRSE